MDVFITMQLEIPPDAEEKESIQAWLSELRSLGVRAKRKNDLNDSTELRDLVNNIKETLYQEYKTAYSKTYC